MNTPILRIYAFVLVLFATLVYFTSKWAVFDAEELEGKNTNRRPLIEAQQIPRGTITTRDGVLIADSVQEGGRRNPVFVRRYPEGALLGHPVGYSFVDVGQAEIEESQNDLLTGEENEFATLIDELRDRQPEGADLTLTIDAEAQRLATQLLQDAVTDPESPGGALVAIEPGTGAVRAMVSIPGYDPNEVRTDAGFERLQQASGSPLLNRAVQSRYPPGSTMKAVTAAAALDSGDFEPDTVLNADSPKEVSGVPLENSGGQSFGDIDMTTALTNSVNTYWAQVGEQLGTETMVEYMERFGFYDDPQLEYPEDEMIASGVVSNGELVESDFDVGRVAIGQGGAEGQILATATQMAQVAATIGNGGVRMEPTFVQQATDPDGRTVEELDGGDEQARAISEESANQLAEMMTNVTREGTASALAGDLPAEFAGKTGTAEIDLQGTNQPWFIMFAPAQDPQIAVAVTVERCQGCFGGDTAGPIATAVARNLLEN